jgi:hypothetical protein
MSGGWLRQMISAFLFVAPQPQGRGPKCANVRTHLPLSSRLKRWKRSNSSKLESFAFGTLSARHRGQAALVKAAASEAYPGAAVQANGVGVDAVQHLILLVVGLHAISFHTGVQCSMGEWGQTEEHVSEATPAQQAGYVIDVVMLMSDAFLGRLPRHAHMGEMCTGPLVAKQRQRKALLLSKRTPTTKQAK